MTPKFTVVWNTKNYGSVYDYVEDDDDNDDDDDDDSDGDGDDDDDDDDGGDGDDDVEDDDDDHGDADDKRKQGKLRRRKLKYANDDDGGDDWGDERPFPSQEKQRTKYRGWGGGHSISCFQTHWSVQACAGPGKK